MNRELLEQYNLTRLGESVIRFEKPAVTFKLSPPLGQASGRSRLGGRPLLPADFVWPRSKQRALDFLVQIDLAEITHLAPSGVLPSAGLLTFFYDLENEPWGFDPAELDGFHVALIAENSLVPHELPSQEYAPPEHLLTFGAAMTLPHFGSRAYDELERELRLSDREADSYFDFLAAYESEFCPTGEGFHHLLGHSANVQGDMQLEAQLVTNGIYCGDPSGYNDPRAAKLESGADAWQLLMQLDSDDRADIMWGDAGMLYYWIRSDDLARARFDRSWVTLQCY